MLRIIAAQEISSVPRASQFMADNEASVAGGVPQAEAKAALRAGFRKAFEERGFQQAFTDQCQAGFLRVYELELFRGRCDHQFFWIGEQVMLLWANVHKNARDICRLLHESCQRRQQRVEHMEAELRKTKARMDKMEDRMANMKDEVNDMFGRLANIEKKVNDIEHLNNLLQSGLRPKHPVVKSKTGEAKGQGKSSTGGKALHRS